MTNGKLRLVTFGAARALTRDGEDGPHLEYHVLVSRTYVG